MKNKKMPLLAIVLVAIVGIVGGTIAYFTSMKEFPNIFKTDIYKTEIEEFFKPEDGENWKPGAEVNKDVFVRNTGNVPVAVRVVIEESWSKDGDAVEKDDKIDDEDVVIKTLKDTYADNWMVYPEDSNVYYYKKALKAGDEIQFLDSVTLNPKLAATGKLCTITYTYKENEEATETITGEELPEGAIKVSEKQVCNSEKNGYAGLEYELKITVTTVQYDAYEEVFEVTKANVDITENE